MTFAGLVFAATGAMAADIAVTPRKLIVVDKLAAATKAKAVFVAKDGAVTKGAGVEVDQIAVRLDVAYADGSAAGAFVVPAGASVDKSPGWLVNKATVAKYVNKDAPDGPDAKVAVIKPAKLLKLVAKGLGDAPIDVLSAGPPAGSVLTAFCVDNGGEQNCHCSELGGCAYKSIAGGTGAKLVCKTGTGDPECGAAAGTTSTISTMTTTSTSTTSSSTTLPTLVCCDFGSFCGGGIDTAGCIAEDGVPTEDAVCDVSGDCVSPPGTGACCCELSSPPFPFACGVLNISQAQCESDCGAGAVFGAVCLPDGSCQFP